MSLSTNQFLYLRFLRMREEFPELNHAGTEPSFEINGEKPKKLKRLEMQWERQIAEREFNRTFVCR